MGRTDHRWLVVATTALAAGAAGAGEADVVGARAECDARRCDFVVSIRHADAGWDHYANAFEVLGPDGTVLGTRVLRHPHVDEQPFTRGLAGVTIPASVERVTLRARDSVHGTGGRTLEIELPPRAAKGTPEESR